MSFEIKTSIVINAQPAKVWQIFTSFEQYPQWNPFIKEVTGKVQVNNRIKINAGGMVFKPTILAYEENKELKWLGHLLLPGLFDGAHQFLLIDNQDGTTTFEQNELFKGILVPFFKQKLDVDTRNGFNEMNLRLKELAEA